MQSLTPGCACAVPVAELTCNAPRHVSYRVSLACTAYRYIYPLATARVHCMSRAVVGLSAFLRRGLLLRQVTAASMGNPKVFMEITADGKSVGRIEMTVSCIICKVDKMFISPSRA